MRNIRAKYEGRCFWGGGKFLWGKVKQVGGKTLLGWVTTKIGGGGIFGKVSQKDFWKNVKKFCFRKFPETNF